MLLKYYVKVLRFKSVICDHEFEHESDHESWDKTIVCIYSLIFIGYAKLIKPIIYFA